MRRWALVLGLLGVLASAGLGWDNGQAPRVEGKVPFGTHDWLCYEALKPLPADLRGILEKQERDLFLGTSAPDNRQDAKGRVPSGQVGRFGDKSKHHIYFSKWGGVADYSAAVRALEEYNYALLALEKQDWKRASFHFGALTHYVADVGCWAHVMGKGSDLVPEDPKKHAEYEAAVDRTIRPKYASEPESERRSEVFERYVVFDGTFDELNPLEATLKVARSARYGLPGTCGANQLEALIDSGSVAKWPALAVRATGGNLNVIINALTDVAATLLVESGLARPWRVWLQPAFTWPERQQGER